MKGAVALARRLNVSELVIASTIIALGTGLPTIAVNLFLVLGNSNGVDVAIGNALGTNFVNIGLGFGIPALLLTIVTKYEVFEKELSRTLSPLEFSIINEWINFGYSDEMIINALKEAISKNKRSLRSVDKILLQWQTRDDMEKEGYSAVSEKWNKDIEQTIKIAKTKWVDDDEK